jgi:eukaryotic-like serine/threonine-protein kinase
MPLTIASTLGPYEIRSEIGAGGMGEVYRAHDTRLGRDVAIKVLPAHFSSDPDRLRRFEQEARAAAALNHPNILAVHQLGTYEGMPYLVSELLQGETLREALRRGALPLRKAMDYTMQIANGLAAAHEKGIVHRDLKPENLFLTRDGRVKILDFGLAKLTQSGAVSKEDRTVTQNVETHPGMVMGTAGYMSPEQVRGEPADHRADLFALGAILYEMLTGTRAFRKPTAAETMTAILNEDPAPIAQLAPATPLPLQRVVHRCLEKNPAQRFQSALDLSFAVEGLTDSSTSSIAVTGRQSRARWPWAAAGAILVLAAAFLAWWKIPPAVPVVESITQLTDDGEPKDAKLVTDGSRIYFNEGQTHSWKIAQVSVTGGPTAAVDTKIADSQIAALSTTGSALLALAGGRGDADYPLWLIPLPAGEPRRLAAAAALDASFFPDGRLLLAHGRDLYVADNDGSNPRKLASMPGIVILADPTVSPDSKRIAFTLYSRGWSTSALYEGAADGTAVPTKLNAGHVPLPCCATWTPNGKYLVYGTAPGKRSDIWLLPTQTGLFRRGAEPIRLTAGPLSYSGAVPSRDGKQIFAIGTKGRGELVRYDMKLHQFLPLLSGISAVGPSFSRDGKWVAYASYPDHTLWRSRADGSERVQLTYSPMEVAAAAISPDGTKVAFRTSDWDLFMINAEGGPAQLVAKHSDVPDWSPDGNLLLFSSFTDAPIGQNTRLYMQVADVRTGKTSEVPGSHGIGGGWWITQDMLIAAPYTPTKFLTFSFKTQRWADLVGGNLANWAVSPDKKYLVFTTGGAEPEVRRLRFADRQVETVTSLKGLRRVVDSLEGTQLDVAPDGSPVFARDIGAQEIYALNVRWP